MSLSEQQLYFDCITGYLPGIQSFLSSGVNINIKLWYEEETLLYLVCTSGHDAALGLPDKNDPNIPIATNQTKSIHIFSQHNYYNCAEFLLQHGADPNTPNINQVTPLSLACQHGDDKCMNLLLKHGADTNIAISNHETPLYMVSRNGCDKCMFLLLQNDADINIANSNQVTPLSVTTFNNHLLCVIQILLTRIKRHHY